MSFVAFLKLAGIDGESNEPGHKSEIEVFSFQYGIAGMAGVGVTSPSGPSRSKDERDKKKDESEKEAHEIAVTTSLNKASPKLFEACATGKKIPKAVLTLRRTEGKDAFDYMQISMEDVYVSHCSFGGPREREVQNFTLNYVKVKWEYKPMKEGKPGSPVQAEWDSSTVKY